MAEQVCIIFSPTLLGQLPSLSDNDITIYDMELHETSNLKANTTRIVN